MKNAAEYANLNDLGCADTLGNEVEQSPFHEEAARLMSAVAKDNGLEVASKQDGDEISFRYYAELNGKEETILETGDSPENAAAQLRNYSDKKVKDLEKTFNVDISEEGETDNRSGSPNIFGIGLYQTRAPNAGEVTALEKSLLTSVPDTETFNGEPLKISFLKHEIPGQTVAFARGREIVIEPARSQERLKHVINHELAHIGQQQDSHDAVPSFLESATGSDDIRREFADKLGWHASRNGWLLEAQDGSFWRAASYGRNVDWLRTDDDGSPLDEKGERTDSWWNPFDEGDSKAQRINSDRMQETARVKPPSNYFPDPAEMWAEMASLFRASEDERKRLFENSEQTYALARELDQKQIDSEFGTNEKGEPRMIRLPNGVVVENTEQHKAEIQAFEQSLPFTN